MVQTLWKTIRYCLNSFISDGASAQLSTQGGKPTTHLPRSATLPSVCLDFSLLFWEPLEVVQIKIRIEKKEHGF
jgi:hypothetical protein